MYNPYARTQTAVYRQLPLLHSLVTTATVSAAGSSTAGEMVLHKHRFTKPLGGPQPDIDNHGQVRTEFEALLLAAAAQGCLVLVAALAWLATKTVCGPQVGDPPIQCAGD